MTRQRGFIATAAAFALAATLFFTTPPAAAMEVLTVGGTGAGLGTMHLLKRAFEKSHPEIRINVLPSLGSSGAIRALSKRALDIGVISRELSPDEERLGLLKKDFATTPFVFVANGRTTIDNLTVWRLEGIFSGRIATWPTGERIRLILRPLADSDTKAVKKAVPEIAAAIDALLGRDGILVALTNQEGMDLVEKTPGALGFTTLTQVVSEGRKLKVLSYDGIRPTLGNNVTAVNPAYPFSQTLSFITTTPVSNAQRTFFDFVASPEGDRILRRSGSVPAKGKPRA